METPAKKSDKEYFDVSKTERRTYAINIQKYNIVICIAYSEAWLYN